MNWGLFQYLLVFLILLVIFFDFPKKKSKNYDKYFKYFFILLYLLAAFKYGMGIDTPNYMVAYENVPPIWKLKAIDFSYFRFNPLYLLTNSICKAICGDYFVLQLLQTTLYFGSTYLLLKELHLGKFYLLVIFYLTTYFTDGYSAMRESFAISFCQFGFYYLLKKKVKTSLVLIFVGCLYHTGAVAFMWVPVSYYLFKDGNKSTLIRFLIVWLLLVFAAGLARNISAISFLSDNSIERYLQDSNSIYTVNYLNILKNLLIVLFSTIALQKNKNINYRLFYLGLAYVGMDIMSATRFAIAYRLSAFYIIFYMYLISSIIQMYSSKKSMLNVVIVVILMFYQPFARYIALFEDEYGKDAYDEYCSVFSSDKSHYKSLIIHSSASDYLLY